MADQLIHHLCIAHTHLPPIVSAYAVAAFGDASVRGSTAVQDAFAAPVEVRLCITGA